MLKTKRKSLLYKSGVEYADFSLNHVEGCAHGCRYPCYAMQMAKRFGKIKTYNDWIRPKLVSNALELLDREIPKYKDQIKFVHLCFMTDPFMYRYKEVSDMSLKIIEKLNVNGIKCTVLTKGIYPNSLANQKKNEINEYGITLVSFNDKFKRRFEPNAAPFEKRIKALKYLHDKGLKTWVSIEPYPTPLLDEKQDIQKLLNKISFVDKIIFGKLNYNVENSQFKYHDEFYEKCANKIVEFCEKNGIKYHIKFGTQKGCNRQSAVIFQKAPISARALVTLVKI